MTTSPQDPTTLPEFDAAQQQEIDQSLGSWQAGLPELERGQSVEEMAAVDRALTQLIGILEGEVS
jgi:hypothetical protein